MMNKLIQKHYDAVKGEIEAAIQSVVNKCDYNNRERVVAFEVELAKAFDIKNAVTCHSSAAAMQMLLMAYGVNRGDAVFMSDFGSLAVAEATKILGATPVFVDVDSVSGCFDLHHLEVQIQRVMTDTKLSPKVVVSADSFGRPEDYLAVNEIIRTYGLILIEDATKSLGGSYKGLQCGCFGHAAITSFDFGSPLFGIGNGAAVLTDFNDVAALVCAERGHGLIDGKAAVLGMESRLDALQAEVMRVKLRHFAAETAAAAEAAAVYDDALKDNFGFLQLPEGSVPSNNEYIILAADRQHSDKIKAALTAKGWHASSLPMLMLHTVDFYYDKKYSTAAEEFAGAAELAEKLVRLPISPYLDAEDQKEIIDTVLGCLD
ncbi:MAG: DegT/DnrJ/EryC1/StrS family aminotransferase [Bacillota bacterium]|jgi:UDP-2-acetamido-2-deoxy-ribo-hexuluronate aminotransferase